MELFFALLFMLPFPSHTQAQIKSVSTKPDEIVNVKLGLGIATIVQLPESIQSVVIGDQSGFKVEYLDHAVTIKPLRYAAMTNIYLTTLSRRYILRLKTGRAAQADYILYVKDHRENEVAHWKPIDKSVSSGSATLNLKRVGATRAGFLLVDMKLSSKDKISLSPDSVWLSQDGVSKVISGLYISSPTVEPNKHVVFGLSILKTDLTPNRPITIEIRMAYPLKIVINAESVWP